MRCKRIRYKDARIIIKLNLPFVDTVENGFERHSKSMGRKKLLSYVDLLLVVYCQESPGLFSNLPLWI